MDAAESSMRSISSTVTGVRRPVVSPPPAGRRGSREPEPVDNALGRAAAGLAVALAARPRPRPRVARPAAPTTASASPERSPATAGGTGTDVRGDRPGRSPRVAPRAAPRSPVLRPWPPCHGSRTVRPRPLRSACRSPTASTACRSARLWRSATASAPYSFRYGPASGEATAQFRAPLAWDKFSPTRLPFRTLLWPFGTTRRACSAASMPGSTAARSRTQPSPPTSARSTSRAGRRRAPRRRWPQRATRQRGGRWRVRPSAVIADIASPGFGPGRAPPIAMR